MTSIHLKKIYIYIIILNIIIQIIIYYTNPVKIYVNYQNFIFHDIIFINNEYSYNINAPHIVLFTILFFSSRSITSVIIFGDDTKNENRINSLLHFQLINDNTRSTSNRNVHSKSMNYTHTHIYIYKIFPQTRRYPKGERVNDVFSGCRLCQNRYQSLVITRMRLHYSISSDVQ